jgi:flagellar motor switch protein FliN/FliY
MENEAKEQMQPNLDVVEIDTIGEILNISMGSAATALSTLLSKTVNITTPTVSVIKATELKLNQYDPAIGIEIEYIEGLNGTNLLVMKRKDIKVIVDLLINGMDESDEEALEAIHVSAVSEIMNQMMGASATSLASFLGKEINISTPMQFDIDHKLKEIGNSQHEMLVSVKFMLDVEDLLHSEFVTIMTIDFTKELVKSALNFEESTEESTQKHEEDTPSAVSETQMIKEVNPVSDEKPQQEAKGPIKNDVPPVVNVKSVQLQSFDEESSAPDNKEDVDNFQLIMGVPLEVSVEIGRTKMSVKNILNVRQGSIVELDRQAGDPVDVIVNGQLIAKGDVVIVDDNFGVRITGILSKRDLSKKFS